MNYDVIIIGGGLGGLTAGAKLAKEGKKVLLVEQHSVPGGCATTFKRKDFTLEVGLHEMDGLDRRDMKTKIFRDLGIFDRVSFLKVPEFYHFNNNRVELTIPHNPEEAKNVLTEAFPAEKQGIEAYFDQVMNARQKAKESAGKPERSVGDFLDSIIGNEDLKLVLLGNLGYFHDDPYSLSLNYYSVAQGSYYSGGGNFIQGGSQKLSDALADVIREHGGEVIPDHIVTQIIIDNNKAAGIRFRKSNISDGDHLEAFSEEVIANAAIPNVAESLLPPDKGRELKLQYEHCRPGPSLLTVYFGFKKPLKTIGSKYYSTFVYDESVTSQAEIVKNNHSHFSTRSFTFVDYSQVDARLAPENKSVAALCCIDYKQDWDRLDKDDYHKRKKEAGEIFTDRLDKLIPGFKEAVEYSEVATPRTISRYTLNPGGSVYGFAQTPARIRNPKITSVENLHFASAWTKIGGGFSGAIFNGYLTAFDLLRRKK